MTLVNQGIQKDHLKLVSRETGASAATRRILPDNPMYEMFLDSMVNALATLEGDAYTSALESSADSLSMPVEEFVALVEAKRAAPVIRVKAPSSGSAVLLDADTDARMRRRERDRSLRR